MCVEEEEKTIILSKNENHGETVKDIRIKTWIRRKRKKENDAETVKEKGTKIER